MPAYTDHVGTGALARSGRAQVGSEILAEACS